MKKNFRKVLCVMLAFLMLMTTAPLTGFVGLELPVFSAFTATAAENSYLTSGFCGEITDSTNGTQLSWVLDDNGTLTVTGEGRMAAEAFKYDLRIKEVIIEDGVENVSDYCFNECSNIQNVILGKDIQEIGKYAFNKCTAVASVTMGDNVTTISEYAFTSCSSLSSINFSEALSTIEQSAFSGCGSLTSLNFGESLKRIEKYAFTQCVSVASVDFPTSLEYIGFSAFSDAKSLTDVVLKGELTTIDEYAFTRCKALVNLVLPDKLTSIGTAAFDSCTSLTSVSFPDSLVFVDGLAFQGCSSLVSLFIGAGLENFSISVFNNCTKLSDISVSEDNEAFAVYDGILYNKSFTEILFVPYIVNDNVEIAASLEVVDYLYFYNRKNIESFSVAEGNRKFKTIDGIIYTADGKELVLCPAGKTGTVNIAAGTEKINMRSFYDCRKITAIVCPDTVTEYGEYAFCYCSGLITFKFSEVLETIGENALSYCYNLKSVTIPDSVISVGERAFTGCNALTTLELGKNIKSIGEYAFSGCGKLSEIILPEALETLDNTVFSNCTSIKNIYFGKNLNEIDVSIFKNCNSLNQIVVSEENMSYASVDGILYDKAKTKMLFIPVDISGAIIIPASISYLEISSLNSCPKITALNVESGNMYYSSDNGVLYSADKKQVIFCPRGKTGRIIISGGTENISESAFEDCTKITSVKFSDSLLQVENYAFAGCTNLSTVEFNDGLKQIGNGVFGDCTKLTQVVLPPLITTISSGLFSGCSTLNYVQLHSQLKVISSSAFLSCTSLTEIEIPESVESIGKDAFKNCSSLKTINIPKSIKLVANNVISNCGFEKLVLPETVQSFDYMVWPDMQDLVIENRYCEYTSVSPLSVPDDCTIHAYCGSPGHELAVKRLLTFESLGHTFLNWYVEKAATYEEEGIERRDCIYCDGYEERPIQQLVDDVFTATFVADGKIVATVDFLKGATEIAEPTVPAKDRYLGAWEDYTLNDENITIEAIYTLIKSGDSSEIETDSEVIHYTGTDDVLFKLKASAEATVVKSTITNVVPLDIVLVVDQSGSMDETLGGKTKKVDALKDAATAFVNTVYENGKLTSVDHRISIVGFGLSGDYSGFEKNENTELLTSANGVVRFDRIKSADYASSLLSVSVNGSINAKILSAIDSIEARGATAADLGFEMAKGVFANTDSADRQRVVVFMTDGEPTYLSGFQTSVANSAIANAYTLKTAYDASVYSVGVFSSQQSSNNINKFMNAVSSGYPSARSLTNMGKGTDGQFYTTVDHTDSLTSVFKSISTESLSHTAPFDDVSVIKTLSEYVTFTSKQEEQLRIDLIRNYGITNDDITVSRNEDGTTTIQVNSLTPYKVTDEKGNVTYEIAFEFFASLNENASAAGDYYIDTEDSGIMLGSGAKGYEATFDTSVISLTSKKTRVIFTINGEVYEVSENILIGYAIAPKIEVSADWTFSGWDTFGQKATNGLVLDATLVKAERTVIWHTADGDVVQNYKEGDIITAPTVDKNADGDIFLSWDKSIPTTMPDENLEYTAVYGGHVHNYISVITKNETCETDGTRTFTCDCGDVYTETITALSHNYEAITPSLEKNDAKCTFVCTNCGDKYDYALDYQVVNASGKRYKVLYEFQLTDDNLDYGFQPDGEIQIRIPLSELHSNAKDVTVIRTNDDGSKTEVPAVIENEFLVITCNHFTPYEVIFDIPCEEHSQGEWIVTKEATCSEEGSRYAICMECEQTVIEETVAKLPHTESEWITDSEPTCITGGSKHTECTVCNALLKTETILKTDHIYSKVVTAPTCTEQGYTTYTCECGDSFISDYVSVSDHNDTDGDYICDYCGEDLYEDNGSTSNCSHMCHRDNAIARFVWKIIIFFCKLFGLSKSCACGRAHY